MADNQPDRTPPDRTPPDCAEPPSASALLLCEDVVRGTVDLRPTVRGLIGAITVSAFPATVGPFAVFVALTNLYAAQRVTITFGLAGADRPLLAVPTASGAASNPLSLVDLVVILHPFRLDAPGRYMLQAVHGGVAFAQSPVIVSLRLQPGPARPGPA